MHRLISLLAAVALEKEAHSRVKLLELPSPCLIADAHCKLGRSGDVDCQHGSSIWILLRRAGSQLPSAVHYLKHLFVQFPGAAP